MYLACTRKLEGCLGGKDYNESRYLRKSGLACSSCRKRVRQIRQSANKRKEVLQFKDKPKGGQRR